MPEKSGILAPKKQKKPFRIYISHNNRKVMRNGFSIFRLPLYFPGGFQQQRLIFMGIYLLCHPICPNVQPGSR